MSDVRKVIVTYNKPRIIVVSGAPGPTGATGATGPAGSSSWERVLVIHNPDGIADGNRSARVEIPAGITTIDKWTLTAEDEDQALHSSTFTLDLRMQAWAAGSWSHPTSGANLSGTMPALSAASSALSTSPGLGSLTPGQFLVAEVTGLSATAPKTIYLTLSAS